MEEEEERVVAKGVGAKGAEVVEADGVARERGGGTMAVAEMTGVTEGKAEARRTPPAAAARAAVAVGAEEGAGFLDRWTHM